MLVKERRERIDESPGSALTESFGVDPEASSKEPVLAVHRVSRSFEGFMLCEISPCRFLAVRSMPWSAMMARVNPPFTKIMTGAAADVWLASRLVSGGRIRR